MAKFKGSDGPVCNVMGQVKAEFIDGMCVTDNPETIDFLIGKGYVPEAEKSKPSVKDKE